MANKPEKTVEMNSRYNSKVLNNLNPNHELANIFEHIDLIVSAYLALVKVLPIVYDEMELLEGYVTYKVIFYETRTH